MCSRCYGIAVLHNGVNINFDEECELKDEGRGNEIEYIEGGMLYDFNYQNSDDDSKIWVAPTLWSAMKWLREVHNIHITIDCDICDSFDFYSTIRIKSKESWKTYVEYEDEGSNTYEEAAEKAVKYCLTNLI